MTAQRADVHHSPSTWQQPVPPTASVERAALIEEIARAILARGPGRLLVGIDGFTAAGKTSFGHELAERLAGAGRPVLRATLDDFKKPWKDRHLYDRESGEGYYRNAYDYESVRRLLLDPARSPEADSCALCGIDPLTQLDHSAQRSPLAPDAVIVVDGVFAFRPEIDDYWDYRVWLDVDAELSVRRGAQRDGDWAGSEAETLHRDRYGVAQRIYLDEVDPLPRTDVVVDNTDFARPRVLPRSRRPQPRPPVTGRDEFDALVIRTDYADDSAWQAVRTALTEDPDLSPRIVDDPAWAGAGVDEVLAAVAGDEDLSVVFLADRTTMTSAHHALLAVTTTTRDECDDEEDYSRLAEFGTRFRTIPAGVHSIHANLSIADMGFEEFAGAAQDDPDRVFRNVA
jgi:uridine kinase